MMRAGKAPDAKDGDDELDLGVDEPVSKDVVAFGDPIIGKAVLYDPDTGTAAIPPVGLPAPKGFTPAAWARHCLTHLPYDSNCPFCDASVATGASSPSFVESIWPGATPLGLLRNAGATAFSGGVSGLATYLWRSPWDTKFKRSVGWRGDDAPLWSWRRFLQSPRGLKAIGLGAATWSAYELADAVLRKLAGAAA